MNATLKFPMGGESIYLGMGITNVFNEFTEDGDICDGEDTFSRLALGSDNYENKFKILRFYPYGGNKWANL